MFKPKSISVAGLFFAGSPQSEAEDKEEIRIFGKASELIIGAEFLLVNCTTYPRVCEEKMASPKPCLFLFRPPKPDPLQFTNEHSIYAIVEFVTGNGKAQSVIPPNDNLKTLSPDNYSNFGVGSPYKIIAFMNSRDRMSQMLYPTLHQLADVFAPEKDMTLGTIDCGIHPKYCISIGVDAAPIVRVARQDGQFDDYVGTREMPFLLKFINEKCQKNRKDDGSLSPVTRATGELLVDIKKFLAGDHKVVQKFEGRPDLATHVRVMKGILKHGVGSVETGLAQCKRMLDEGKVVGSARVNLEGQLEVFEQFKEVLGEQKEL
jgi:hypothetical protein